MKDNLKGQINQPLFKAGDKVVINITEPRIEGYFYFFTAMGNGSVCTVIKATQYHYNPHGSPRYKDLEKWIESDSKYYKNGGSKWQYTLLSSKGGIVNGVYETFLSPYEHSEKPQNADNSLQKLEMQLINDNTMNTIQSLDTVLGTLVYHNSPYLLKKANGSFIDPKTGKKLGFDHRFMGKGEGAQVHGWGCYFSVKDLRKYAENLPAAVYYDGKLLKDKISELAYHALTANNLNIDNAIYSLKRKIETIKNSSIYSEEAKKSFLKKYEDIIPELEHLDQSKITRDNNNHNYVVEIPDDDGFNYLEEDKPIKPKQLAKIVSYLNKKDKKTGDYFKTLKGTLCSNIYYELTLAYKTKEMASKFLKKCGIVGIHYFGKTDGECYVIFDENDANIVKHTLYGISGTPTDDEKRIQDLTLKIWKSDLKTLPLEEIDNLINDIKNDRIQTYNDRRIRRIAEQLPEDANGGRLLRCYYKSRSKSDALIAAAICGGSSGGVDSRSLFYKRELVLQQWAKHSKCWIDDIEEYARQHSWKRAPELDGTESMIYTTPNGFVAKIWCMEKYHENLRLATEKIILNNFFFGEETFLNVIGFTKVEHRLRFVLLQPKIKHIKENVNYNGYTIRKYLREKFPNQDIGKHEYTYIVFLCGCTIFDLHGGNVVKSENGNFYVIDCNILYTKENPKPWYLRGLSSTPNAKSIGKNLSGMIDLNTQKMLWNYDFVPSDNKIFSSDTWRHKSNKVSIAFQAPKYYILIWDNDIVKAERKKYSNFINYFPEILKKIQKLIDKEYNIPTFHINDLITYKGYEETIFKIVAIKGNNYIVIDLADRTKTKNEIPMSDNDKLQIVNIDLLTKEIELEANNLGNVVESLQPSGLSGIDDEEFSKELLVTEMRLLELEKLKDFGEKIGGSAKDRYFGRKIKENTDTTKPKGYNRLPTLDEIENFGYKCLHTQFKPSVADFEEFGLNKICARLCFFHYYGIFDKDSGYNANSILDIYGLYDDKSIQDAVTSYFIENKYHTQNYATKYFAPDLKIHFYAIDFVYTALSLNLEKGLKDDFDYKNVLKLHNRGNKMWKIYRDKYIFQDKGKDNVPEDVKQRVFNICYENALTNFPVFRVMHSYNNGIVFMLEKDMSEGTRTWRFSLSVNHISNLEEGICENSWGDLYSHYAELYVKGKELYAQKYGIEEPDKWRFKDKEGLFAKVREGKDWRNGRNAEPKDFIDTFGFRAVEFGETMPQKERWEHLNRTFDSFMDLCDVLNIKPENISLGGSLAISFGSRGRGGKHAPAAHYEPTKKVINLTRRNGAGCLAHEWFHAFDNQVLPVKIGVNEFPENRGKFASNDYENIWDTAHRVGLNRPDDYEYFYKLNNLQTNYNGFIDASFNLDKYERRSPKYWSTCIEYSARAFEWYVIKKLSDKNQINEYLAQIPTAEPDHMKYYPYPHPVDYIEIESIFNGIFANVQQVKTETGVTIR